MIAQANMMLQTSNLMKLLSSPPPSAQNMNVNIIANFSQLVNILQGLGGSQQKKQNDGEAKQERDNVNTTQAKESENNSVNVKGLIGETPFVSSSTGLLGDAPPGSQAKEPAPTFMDVPITGTVGPANPLLALFLEQQIRQQISSQQCQTQESLNQISELVSNSLKRRHVSVNNNTHPQLFSSPDVSGGLLPTPSNPPSKPLLPIPGDGTGAVRELFGGNPKPPNSGHGNSFLPTPGSQVDNNDNCIPHLMQSFISGGITVTGGLGRTGREELNSPAKKFPKMERYQAGGQKAGLLGDIPEHIKRSIIGYATGKTSNSAPSSSNKENNLYDPTTVYWERQVMLSSCKSNSQSLSNCN